MMTKDGLIFEANSLKQGRLQALTRQQLQAQATQNRERRWVALVVLEPIVLPEQDAANLEKGSQTRFDPGDQPFGLWVSNDDFTDGGGIDNHERHERHERHEKRGNPAKPTSA
jgi:hypothetical protein